jgi:site-specific recombinase XerD
MLSEIERFVNWVRRRSPEAHTWQDYRCDLRFFLETVGDRPPNTITFQDVDRFILAQSEKGFQPATINRRLAAITALYAFLMPEDDELACPVFPRRHHLREPERLPRPVQEDDLREFFAVIDSPRDLAMFTLMLRCGLRIGEVAKLELSDLYLSEDTPRMLVRGKGSRQRVAYLSEQAVRVLREYLATRPTVPCESVFLSYQLKGLTTHSIHMRLLHYRELAGLTLTCHRLRHSFANDLLNVEMPITSIQKLMGHRWIETTQTYVQANDKQVQADFLSASRKLQGWA